MRLPYNGELYCDCIGYFINYQIFYTINCRLTYSRSKINRKLEYTQCIGWRSNKDISTGTQRDVECKDKKKRK